MESKYNHLFIPSLEHITTVSIVSTLYKQQDILDIIRTSDKEEILKETEQLLIRKFLLLPLPKTLKNDSRVSNICKIVALQAYLAIDLEREFYETRELEQCICGFEFLTPLEYFGCLSFKMDGSVDMLKTFTLMHQRNYPIHKIFIAAAHLCSEELASRSWATILSDLCFCPDRSNVCETHLREKLEINITNCVLMNYWINLMTKQSPNLSLNVKMQLDPLDSEIIDLGPINIFESIFRFSSRYVNSHAAKYFFHILTDEGLSFDIETPINFSFNVSLLSNAEIELNSCKVQVESLDMALFLLSKVEERERQIEILNIEIENLITSLISNLSYQKFVEPVMQFIWSSLDSDDFLRIFKQILKLICNGNYVAIKIFKQIWKESDSELRKSFSDHFVASLNTDSFDCDLFDVHFFDVFKVITSGNTDEIKIHYLCSLANVPKLCSSIRDLNYLKIIDASLNQILSTDSEMINFRGFVVKKCFRSLLFDWINEDEYETIDKFLEWGSTSLTEFEKNCDKKLKFSTQVLDYSVYFRHDTAMVRCLNWFKSTEIEITGFKNLFACESRFRFQNWELFLKFVDWCFDCEQDVQNYKTFLSKYENLQAEMWRIADNNFEYVDNLLNWCLTSSEDIHRFRLKHFSRELHNATKEIFLKKKDADRLHHEYPTYGEIGANLGEWYCRNGRVGTMRKIVLRNALNCNKSEIEKGNSGKPMPFFTSLGWVDMEMEMEFFESLVLTLESHHTYSCCDILFFLF